MTEPATVHRVPDNNTTKTGRKNKKKKNVYCMVCRKQYCTDDFHKHVHDIHHHRKLEDLLPKEPCHHCQACKMPSMHLETYGKHISTAQHRKNMGLLLKKRFSVKVLSLKDTLGAEQLDRVMAKLKDMKKEKRKAKGKQKKAALKAAANAGLTQNTENKKQTPQQTQQNGNSHASGPQWQHPSQSTSQHQAIKDSVLTMSEIDIINRNYDRSNSRSGVNMCYAGQSALTDQLKESKTIYKTFEQKEDRGNRSSPGQERVQNLTATTSTRPDGPTDSGQLRDVDVSSILRQVRRELGVREPCRAERAARSQKQNQEAGGVKEEVRSPAQQTTLEKLDTYPTTPSPSTTFSKLAHNKLTKPQSLQCPQVDTTIVPVPRVGTQSPKLSAVKVKKNTQSEGTSESRSDSDGLSGSWERGSSSGRGPSAPRLDTLAASLTRPSTSAEPNLDAARRIRHVSESHKAEPEKEGRLRPTVKKLLSSSAKVDWNEMYQEVNRKKKEKVKGKPRFGIEMVKPYPDQGEVNQDQELEDFALSEGFHWDSVLPSDPPPAPRTPPASSPQNTAVSDPIAERPTQALIPEPTENPSAALVGGGRSIQAMMLKDRIKVEPETNDVPSESNLNAEKKRKKDGDNMGTATVDQSRKKRRLSSNEDQSKVDQLLMVSLKEDKLCQSLQEIDNSLVVARNALQAAYMEVQRLLLLKQQCTMEVNTLRTQRIEILQGMQDGYTDVGTSDVGESSGSTQARAAATASPRPAPRPLFDPAATSSLHTTPSRASPAPSITFTPPTTSPLTLPRVMKTEPGADEPARNNSTSSPHTARNSPVPNSSLPAFSSLLLPSSSHASMAPPAEAQRTAEANTGRAQDEAASVPDVTRGGNDSDGSLEYLDPLSGADVIDLDDSDGEVSKPSVAPERSSSVQISTVASQTQTVKAENMVRKIEAVSVNNSESADTAVEEEPALGAFKNHTGPVYGMQVHDGLLYTCSGDNTVHAYSLVTKDCVTVFEGHTNKVNCLLVSSLPGLPTRLYTGSSDKTVCCYSIKSKKCLEQKSLPDRVLCLHIAWKILYVGVADGSVFSFDAKTLKQLDVFECHGARGVSCMSTAQEGARRILLAGSYDSTISVRDAKSGLILRTLTGHTKTVLCLKVVNDLVFSGSSDTSVHAHNIHTGELVRIYKGHSHAVTAIAILGKVMVTASLDRFVRVHELQSHERLQVYGGHSDMVMCMAIYKSTIYTGCYDGSVQAVRLNLTKNYRCWWHGCSLIFGISEHLLQHLLRDHSNPQLQTVKCRWRDCSSLFSTQDSVRQDLPDHMQYHVEHNSKQDV